MPGSSRGAAADVPAWLASRIRRSELSATLSELAPVLAVLFLLACVELLWWTGAYQSIPVLLFWNILFFGALYLVGRPFLRALGGLLRPGRSPEVAYLRRFGPLKQTVDQLTAEVQFAGVPIEGTDALFTPHWLVISGRSRFAARRLADLREASLRTSWVRFHFVIPLWRRRSVVFRAAGAPDAETRATAAGVEALLAYAGRFPSVVRGPDGTA